jgi:hypothetical protein
MFEGWHRYARLHKGGSPDALRIQAQEGKRLNIGWGGHAPHWIEIKRRLCQPFFLPIPVHVLPQTVRMFTRMRKLTLTSGFELVPGKSGRKAVEWEFKIPDWARVILARDLARLAEDQAGPYRS